MHSYRAIADKNAIVEISFYRDGKEEDMQFLKTRFEHIYSPIALIETPMMHYRREEHDHILVFFHAKDMQEAATHAALILGKK
jgi:hypothetical protein